MQFYQRLRVKLAIAFAIVAIIPVVIVGLYSLQFTSQNLLDQEFDAQAAQVESDEAAILSFLNTAQSDVRFLGNSSPLQQFLSFQSADKKKLADLKAQLTAEFLAFAQSRDIYYQIRYIDETGQEIVRVDTKNGTSLVIPANRLQNKGDRYYFKKSVILPASRIFVSPLDLNRERGEVEVPHKAVIRYAVPVRHKNGKRAGIVITNVDANRFLGSLKRSMLLDKEGFYFTHNDESKRWGSLRDLGTGANFSQDVPEYAESILNSDIGHVETSQSVLSYRRLEVPGGNGQQWMLISQRSTDELMSGIQSFRITWGLILGAGLFLALVVAMILDAKITRPIEYLTEAAEMVSTGNLARQIQVDDKSEIGQLAVAFERMRVSMNKMMERMRKKS